MLTEVAEYQSEQNILARHRKVKMQKNGKVIDRLSSLNTRILTSVHEFTSHFRNITLNQILSKTLFLTQD